MRIDDLIDSLFKDVVRPPSVDANSPGEMVRSQLAGQMPGQVAAPRPIAGAPVAPVERSALPAPMGAGVSSAAPAASPAPAPMRLNPLGSLARGYSSGGLIGGIANMFDEPALLERQQQEKSRTEQQALAQQNDTIAAIMARDRTITPQQAAVIARDPVALREVFKPLDPNADLSRRKTEAEIAKLEQEARGGGDVGQPAGLLSKGFRYNRETGTMEAVPGGPADQKQVAKQQGDKTALDYTFTGMDRLASSVNALLQNDRGLGRITGAMSVLPNIPGGDAANAQAQLETLKAQVAFQTLQDMRNASKTGGALGQVTERELAMLQNALVPLEQAQSYDQFKKAMQDILKFTEESKARVRSAYDRIYSGEQGQQSAPDNDLKAKYGLE